MALPVSEAGTATMMKPGMAAKVKPIPIPAIPAATNASQSARCSTAKNRVDTANTTEPNGIMLRTPNRLVYAVRHRLATKDPAERGTKTRPDVRMEAPKP